MAIVQVPRNGTVGRVDVPPEPAPIKDLLDLRDRVDTGRRKAEIIEGRLVVSPMPVIWHEEACHWLFRRLMNACDAKGWFIDRGPEIMLPKTSDLIEPDLAVLRQVEELSNLDSRRPLDRVLLVAEVISPSSIREDREVKPQACAIAGVPIYLLIDRFTKPVSVSLHTEPADDGYARVVSVNVCEKLQVPAPFEVTLDTATLPLPR
jgi:Uma2 family endonuclease